MNKEKEYIDAFNNGYLIAQFEPDLSKILSQSVISASCLLQVFFAGKKQFEIENARNQIIELQNLRNHSQTKESNLER